MVIQEAGLVLADNLAWDPDYMGSSMMVPVVYVTWFMAVIFCSLLGKRSCAVWRKKTSSLVLYV